jgi:hypothetical protein
MSDPAPRLTGLTLQPMVHVEDMAASITFLEHLGGRVRQGSRDGDWALVEINGAELSLLAHPPNPEQHEGAVELNFEAAADLSEVERDLRRLGVRVVGPATETGFGRQLQIESPDGLLVKINQLGPNP